MYLWGLSWGWHDYTECASGTYFLEDLPWALQGLGGALVVGAIAAAVLAFKVRGVTGVLVAVVLVVLIGSIAEEGARIGVENGGCRSDWIYFGPFVPAAWLSGMAAIGAIPAYLIALAVRRARR